MRRILLIDDAEEVHALAGVVLGLRDSWSLTSALSGEEGVELALAEPPDAIVLDVILPGMSGLEALAALRADARTRHVPVVLLTGKDRPDSVERLRALEVKAVIAKPFDPLTLADDIAQALGWT